MEFTLDKISGFKAYTPSLIVYDGDGIPFYQMKADNGVIKGFNLPSGTYMCDTELIPVKKMVYRVPSLPKPERNICVPSKIDLSYQPNPSKCSVDKTDPDVIRIICDPMFRDYPKPTQIFILNHELAHYLYATELYCDMYSAKLMLEKGFNPSQVYNACHITLHGRYRKDGLYDFLEKVKIK